VPAGVGFFWLETERQAFSRQGNVVGLVNLHGASRSKLLLNSGLGLEKSAESDGSNGAEVMVTSGPRWELSDDQRTGNRHDCWPGANSLVVSQTEKESTG
jgi:hypothetical protein